MDKTKYYGNTTGIDQSAKGVHLVVLALAMRDVAEDRRAVLAAEINKVLLSALWDHGCRLPEERIEELPAVDVALNAQGLVIWLDKQIRCG